MARIIAIDVGTKTIGIAVSDPSGRLARLERTLSRLGVKKDIEALLSVIQALMAQRVVIGLPFELDGSEGRSARLARQIGTALREAAIPITYLDERFSSVEAQRLLIESGMRRERRQSVIDQAAAALLLQSYLDYGDWTKDSESTPEPIDV